MPCKSTNVVLKDLNHNCKIRKTNYSAQNTLRIHSRAVKRGNRNGKNQLDVK